MKGRHGLKVGNIAKVDEAGGGGREQCLGIIQTEHYKSRNRQLSRSTWLAFFCLYIGIHGHILFFFLFLFGVTDIFRIFANGKGMMQSFATLSIMSNILWSLQHLILEPMS